MAYEEAELRLGIFEAFAEAAVVGREWFDGVRVFSRRGSGQKGIAKCPPRDRRGSRPRSDCCLVCGARAPSHRCLDAPLILSFPVGRFG